MFYLEIILSWGAAALSLVICVYNSIKKHRSASNIILSVIALVAAGLFSLIGINRMDPGIIPAGLIQRFMLSLLMILAALLAIFFSQYPYRKQKYLVITLAASIPGYGATALIMATDYIVANPSENHASNILAEGYPVYLGILTAYLLFALIVIGFKSSRPENRAQRNELVYLIISLSLLFSSFITLSLYLPYFMAINQFSTFGILIPIPLVLIILNYAALDVKNRDLKDFFSRAFYWILLLSLLIVPTTLILKFNTVEYLTDPVPPLGVALVLFMYLFLVYKYLSPRIESLTQRRNRSFIAQIDELFTRELSSETREGSTWEDIIKALVDGVVAAFGIDHAHFYIYSQRENKFIIIHDSVKSITDKEINMSSPLLEMVRTIPDIFYKPFVYSGAEFAPYKDGLLEFLERSRIEVIIPFMDPEKKIIGLCALGPLSSNTIYSKSILAALDLYRIQLQQYLANALMLEQVRATQVIDHDQMVVSTIKKKIIPQKINQLEGYRISSFYINNSTYGGDYFDSILIGDDRVALFMSDSSYSGIDSAIISLELYTILHTPAKIFDAPEKILGTMNWVISTSRFSNKHAAAYCAIISSSGDIAYASAAYNPLILYTPSSDTFTACETGGVPIGADRAVKYESKTVRLTPGSFGILYSDGLSSAINDRGEVYGFSRVREIIRAGKGKSPADLTRAVFEDFNQYIKNKKQINDVSLILFKYK